jgi:hypothetical protein
MSSSNSWAEFAALFRNTTREAFLDHERAKTELKALMPEEAKESDRTWRARQAIQGRRGELRCPGCDDGGRSCPGPVNRSRLWRAH